MVSKIDSIKLLLPSIFHETTHFLEENTLGCNKSLGDGGILAALAEASKENKEDDIWKIAPQPGVDVYDAWVQFLKNERETQRDTPSERMTTLVERIVLGSLYGVIDERMLDGYCAVLRKALAEQNLLQAK